MESDSNPISSKKNNNNENNNNIALKNFSRIKSKSQFNYSQFKNYSNSNKESISKILDYLTSREKYLFVIDINKFFFESISINYKKEIKNQAETNTQIILCIKILKEDFNKIEVYRNLLFNYGLNQPAILSKYEAKFPNLILYRSIYLLSFYLFKDLQQLDLQKQNMGPDSLILLNVLIKKSNALVGINLAYNNLSDDGCKILKGCLEFNKSLQSLNLECNSIGDLGLSYLTNPIVYHKSLKTIKLALNVITIVGMDSLVIALKSNIGNSQINVIDFKYNNYKIESDEKYKDFKFLKISYNWEIVKDLFFVYNRLVIVVLFIK